MLTSPKVATILCMHPNPGNETRQQEPIKARGRIVERITFRLAAIVMLSLYIGLEVELWNVNRLPDSSYLYESKQVCALYLPTQYSNDFLSKSIFASLERTPPSNMSDAAQGNSDEDEKGEHVSSEYAPLVSVTHASAEIVRSNEGIVQHCGNCGQCSNPQDISIYDDTRNTLFQSTLHCSMRALLQGRTVVSDCLQRTVGFTNGCNECWVDNIMCDTRHCLFTCAWTALTSKIRLPGSNEDAPQLLNACLQRDETRCGPAFLQCAGANRRRTGILSDIRRDPNEVCEAVYEEWWKSESLQSYYKLTGRRHLNRLSPDTSFPHPKHGSLRHTHYD